MSDRPVVAVTASLRYPGREKGEDFLSVFSPLEVGPVYSAPRHLVRERVQECGPATLPGKLQFVAVKGRARDRTVPEGPGALPRDLACAGALTVYNTAQSPYSRGDKSDPLEARTRARRQQEEQEEQEEQGPVGGGAGAGGAEELFYSPELGDLPDFDLPDDLMLPNIAQDLHYSQVGGWRTGPVEESPRTSPASPPPPWPSPPCLIYPRISPTSAFRAQGASSLLYLLLQLLLLHLLLQL